MSKGRWFRFYDGVLDNPKIQMLPPDIFRAWVNYLCLASRNGGILPSEHDLAFALRVDLTEVKRLSAALISAGMMVLEGGIMKPNKWDEYQYSSDNAAERMRRYRERNALRNTLHNCSVPERESTETDTDQNREREAPEKLFFEKLAGACRGRRDENKVQSVSSLIASNKYDIAILNDDAIRLIVERTNGNFPDYAEAKKYLDLCKMMHSRKQKEAAQ